MQLGKEFFRYVIPSMLAFALSGIYSIADGFFVGNELGDAALTAINVAYPLTALIQCAGTGIGMGGAILYSLAAGADQSGKKQLYYGMSVLLLAAAGLLLTAAVFFVSPSVLRLFGAEGEILSLGEEYMRSIALGALFQVFGTGLTPFLRNMGGSVAAMFAMSQICFATRVDFDHAKFSQEPDGEIKEQSNTAGLVVVAGMLTAFAVGGSVVAIRMVLTLRGFAATWGFLTYLITGLLAVVAVVVGWLVLVLRLKERYYRFEGGAL